MTDFQKAAARLLRARYPAALLLTEELPGGMQRPCIQLLLEGITLRKEMGRRWRREERLAVYWYPPDGEPPEGEEGALQLLLKTAARGVDTEATRETGRLVIRCTLPQILFMSEEEADLMKRLTLGYGEQLAEKETR